VEIDAKFFYANAVEVTATAFDISLKFQRRGTPTDTAPTPPSAEVLEGTGTIFEALIVGMSPQNAKALVAPLFQMVHEYEKRFGTINLAPELMGRWQDMLQKVEKKP